ncbi:coiled-coil domain-containing protein [Campylobacter concisus]|uniref:coiled-coil domain-containing protein n=1 Tax=Campylobacter concisus TaxID=199 RepID=UPI000D324C1C|nr:hypothetical protein [Campylobacter concisus]
MKLNDPYSWEGKLDPSINRDSDNKLYEILNNLCRTEEAPNDNLVSELREIYKDNFRHSYSSINASLISISKGDITKITIIANKLLEIYKEVEKSLKASDKNEEEFLRHLFKLYDHINLEAVQLQFMTSTSEQIRKTESNIQNTENKINEQSEEVNKTKESIQITKNEIEQVKNVIEKTQANYIAILGIFASIIIAFVANMSFSASVLQNIDKPNTLKLVAIICFLGIFIVNILNLLFNFIREIHFGKRENNGCCSKLWLFNVIIIFIATMCLIKSLEYDKKYSPKKDNNSTINFNITAPRS